jgi:hypothetical protein
MKMRRIVLLIAAAACLAVGCSRSQKFTVQGTLKDIKFPKADSVRMESELLEKPIFAPVNDKAFVLQGKVKSPTIGKLYTVGTRKRNSRFMILEKGTITFKDGIPCGTPLNDSTAAFTARLKSLTDKFPNPEDKEARQKAFENEFIDFVARHKDDPCAVYAILLAQNRMEPEVLLRLIRSTSPKIQNDGDVHALKKNLTMGK